MQPMWDEEQQGINLLALLVCEVFAHLGIEILHYLVQ